MGAHKCEEHFATGDIVGDGNRRRDRTPEGILTRFSATALGRMVKAIEAQPDPATIDLGFTLLTLGEDTVLEVSAGIEQLAKQGIADGKNHDVTVGLRSGGTGLTIHCNDAPIGVA